MSKTPRKIELINLIYTAGLEEDFLKWLSKQGYKDIVGKLDNVPIDVIERYVHEKKLSQESGDEELFKEINSIDYYEETYIRARRIKS
ncbi:MAG: hypothetical protein ABWW65_01960 [Thermoprotei archaeon]